MAGTVTNQTLTLDFALYAALVTYCCVTNHPNRGRLQQAYVTSGAGVRPSWVLCPRSHTGVAACGGCRPASGHTPKTPAKASGVGVSQPRRSLRCGLLLRAAHGPAVDVLRASVGQGEQDKSHSPFGTLLGSDISSLLPRSVCWKWGTGSNSHPRGRAD